MSQIINRFGETNKNLSGKRMVIIEYINCHDILVKIENGEIVHTNYNNFKIGKVGKLEKSCNNNLNDKNSIKKQIIKRKPIDEEIYKVWSHMRDRTSSKSIPTYKDVKCCEEWDDIINFVTWYENNYYEINGERMELDKDILVKGNKIYSPNTCVFVPHRINSLFTKRQNKRGDYPIGVSYDMKSGLYMSRCRVIDSNKSTQKYIGCYSDINEAFNSYKIFKEQYIKEVADEYKDRIPKKLYEAMYNWKVEITD